MPLDKDIKAQIIQEYRQHEKDVGSPEVQIGILTKRIEQVARHMEGAPKDLHSRRGLLALVAKRRRLLNYMKKRNPEKYKELIGKLGLRK